MRRQKSTLERFAQNNFQKELDTLPETTLHMIIFDYDPGAFDYDITAYSPKYHGRYISQAEILDVLSELETKVKNYKVVIQGDPKKCIICYSCCLFSILVSILLSSLVSESAAGITAWVITMLTFVAFIWSKDSWEKSFDERRKAIKEILDKVNERNEGRSVHKADF